MSLPDKSGAEKEKSGNGIYYQLLRADNFLLKHSGQCRCPGGKGQADNHPEDFLEAFPGVAGEQAEGGKNNGNNADRPCYRPGQGVGKTGEEIHKRKIKFSIGRKGHWKAEEAKESGNPGKDHIPGSAHFICK